MKTNTSGLRKKAAFMGAMVILALTAGGALAAIPSTSSYLASTQPMISGEVLWVNEHELGVATEQGEDVALAMDTRTMVPVDLGPGMVMRVEFHVMDDGRKYARRIIPIRSGMSARRELAYANERAIDPVAAQFVSTTDGQGVEEGHGTASAALSATNQSWGTPLAATPSTQAYRVAMQPMIAGRVVTVNDHRIVVDTDQGQRVALEMDSRTIVPTDLATGMTVRVDYKALASGPKYARRITPIESTSNGPAWTYVASPQRLELVAQNTAVTPAATSESESPSLTTNEEPEGQLQAERQAAESLPQTASHQPLIALLGFLALGGAGAVAIVRRRFAS